VLGEFFVCDQNEIDETLLASGPSGRYSVVTANGLGPVEIATLGQILDAGSYHDLFELSADAHREAESGEAGVVGVPSSVCDALAAASDLSGVAERWATTEELRLSRWRSSDALGVLTELSRLVRSRAEKPVWYWWSL
jgi:hypothetical protein